MYCTDNFKFIDYGSKFTAEYTSSWNSLLDLEAMDLLMVMMTVWMIRLKVAAEVLFMMMTAWFIHYFEGGQGGDRPPSGDWCWGLVPPMAKKNCPPSES